MFMFQFVSCLLIFRITFLIFSYKMTKFLHILIKLASIIHLIIEIKSQIARCDYLYQNHWTIGYKATNASYYKCDLDTRQSNYYQNIIRIDGQHKARHKDNNVKWISLYNEMK
ncbi:hypothetical protein ACKWTF_015298 [Chironomus riparius]